jgi:hypothetical protein
MLPIRKLESILKKVNTSRFPIAAGRVPARPFEFKLIATTRLFAHVIPVHELLVKELHGLYGLEPEHPQSLSDDLAVRAL